MDVFDTQVAGIPCQCTVYGYAPEIPMRITGSGFGDADPPEPAVFDFRIMDRRGYPAPWLEAKLQPGDADRLLHEYLNP